MDKRNELRSIETSLLEADMSKDSGKNDDFSLYQITHEAKLQEQLRQADSEWMTWFRQGYERS